MKRTNAMLLFSMCVALCLGCSPRQEAAPPPASAPTPETSTPTVAERVVAFAASPSAPASSLDPLILSSDSLGPIRIGMSLEEANQALGAPLLRGDADGPADEDTCWQYGLPNLNGHNGPSVMTENRRVVRFSIYDSDPGRTPEGIHLGSTDAEVRAAYGAAVIQEGAPYLPRPAHDLIVWTNQDRSRGYRFEVGENGKVWAIHAGGRAILYIEGCA